MYGLKYSYLKFTEIYFKLNFFEAVFQIKYNSERNEHLNKPNLNNIVKGHWDPHGS